MIKILFLAANPTDTAQLRLGEEVREIKERLRQADLRDEFVVVEESAVRVTDLHAHLLRHQPQIVHFSGHGSRDGRIILEDDDGQTNPVQPDSLRSLFKTLKDNIRLVFLNACYSEIQAAAIVESVECVIGMTRAIPDRSAIAFASSFYQALGYGRSIQTAFDLGCNEIALEHSANSVGSIPEVDPGRDLGPHAPESLPADIPKLKHAEGVDPASMYLLPRKEASPRQAEIMSPGTGAGGDPGPRKRRTSRNAVGLVEAALNKLEIGQVEQASLYAQQAMASAPASADAHYARALVQVMLGNLTEAETSFEEALRLNPNHGPSLYGAAITLMETLEPSREAVERVRAASWLGRLMELVPPHQQTHQAAKRLLAELPGYRPTLIAGDPAEARKRARRQLYLRIREGQDSGGLRIRSWLEVLPPWSFIAGLHFPVEVSSLAFAALPYAMVLACNFRSLSLLFFLKFGVIALIIFLGYWHAFLFSRMMNYYLGKLRSKQSMPGDDFETWCLEKIASFWGSINLGYSVQPTQDLLRPPPLDDPALLAAARRKAAFHESVARLRRDRQIVWSFVLLFLIVTPVNIWCAADTFSASPAGISRFLMYVLEVYSAVWSFHLVCTLLVLAPGIINRFLDENIGSTPSLSVAPLGYLYLGLGFLATYTYGITLVQHYLWQTHETAYKAAVAMNVICAFFTLVAIVAPQVLITIALCEVKDRRLEEYSRPLEDIDELRRQEETRSFLKKTLSTWWFDGRSLLAFIALASSNLLMLSTYLYLVYRGVWLFPQNPGGSGP
jgi:tetratricopeptide (TPR) repeat protein